MNPKNTFAKCERLLSSRDFDECLKRARKVATEHFLVFVRDTQGPSRLGLILKRQIGNAVTRNRWKRKIREIFRTRKHAWNRTCDIVVMVRKRQEKVPRLSVLEQELGSTLLRKS